jgi:hypothetical protein
MKIRGQYKFQSVLVVALLCLTSLSLSAQTKKIKTLEVSDTILQAFVDRPGDLYVFTQTGHLQRFDKDGRLLNLYRKGPSLTSFDPRDGSRLFAFYRNDAHYDLLNPGFEVVNSYKIDSAFALEPWLVCASADHFVWALDASDWSLKKIDMRNGNVPVEVTLSFVTGKKKEDLVALREYQNFIFLLDRKEGILIFNTLGKLIRTIPQGGLRTFNFIGEELYYLKGDALYFFDLFTAESREMKLPSRPDIVLVTDERMFLVKARAVEVFEFQP